MSRSNVSCINLFFLIISTVTNHSMNSNELIIKKYILYIYIIVLEIIVVKFLKINKIYKNI